MVRFTSSTSLNYWTLVCKATLYGNLVVTLHLVAPYRLYYFNNVPVPGVGLLVVPHTADFLVGDCFCSLSQYLLVV